MNQIPLNVLKNLVVTFWLNCVRLYCRIRLIINHCIFHKVLFSGGQGKLSFMLFACSQEWMVDLSSNSTRQKHHLQQPCWLASQIQHVHTHNGAYWFSSHICNRTWDVLCSISGQSTNWVWWGNHHKNNSYIIGACASQLVMHAAAFMLHVSGVQRIKFGAPQQSDNTCAEGARWEVCCKFGVSVTMFQLFVLQTLL